MSDDNISKNEKTSEVKKTKGRSKMNPEDRKPNYIKKKDREDYDPSKPRTRTVLKPYKYNTREEAKEAIRLKRIEYNRKHYQRRKELLQQAQEIINKQQKK